ncbi:MAG: hypothetical protein QG656_552, partial [Candidatus Hydrogenedentes bacterium]|nr:hypothetical protein [Candidatus Hydrogenedentota bacterium]
MTVCLSGVVSLCMVFFAQSEMFAPGIPYDLMALPIYDDPANPPTVTYNVAPLESPAKEAAEALQRRLEGPRTATQPVEGLALLNMGPRALPYLFSLLRNENSAARLNAAETFLYVSPEDRALMPVLATAIQEDAVWVRLMAAHALGEIATAEPEAAVALLGALGDKVEAVRVCALNRLKDVKVVPAEAIPVLLPLLKSESAEERSLALWVAGRLNPDELLAMAPELM